MKLKQLMLSGVMLLSSLFADAALDSLHNDRHRRNSEALATLQQKVAQQKRNFRTTQMDFAESLQRVAAATRELENRSSTPQNESEVADIKSRYDALSERAVIKECALDLKRTEGNEAVADLRLAMLARGLTVRA